LYEDRKLDYFSASYIAFLPFLMCSSTGLAFNFIGFALYHALLNTIFFSEKIKIKLGFPEKYYPNTILEV